VKTLPDNPNLDHLRQQAKDLLAGLRDTDPTVSLADAQASLANQYGFRTWTDLKAEVDRQRAVDVADDGLARAIADRYGLGEVTGPMRPVVRDEMGRQWSLETDRGRWAARTMDGWIPIVDAETDVALQQAAASHGVVLPAPVRSRAGAIIEVIGEHPWRVCEWLHSGPPLAAPVSATATRQVGAVLATIHRLALPVDRISPWHGSRLFRTSWPDLAATAKGRGARWADALAEAVPTLVDVDTIGELEPSAAPVLCHNALGPANARLGPRGDLIVVGWEHTGGQPPSWEVGDALMHWTVNPGGGINTAGVRAMVDGYRTVAGGMPPMDITMFSGAATSFANYLYGEVNMALDAADEEDRRHADRSVRHLLSHLPSRSTMERLLDVALAAVATAHPIHA
jgi:Ser/Thr protein kinase RdoA (MazF antagonist)